MVGGEGGAGPIIKIRKNKQWGLGPEWAMSKFRKPPYHNLEKPHRLVVSNNNNINSIWNCVDNLNTCQCKNKCFKNVHYQLRQLSK